MFLACGYLCSRSIRPLSDIVSERRLSTDSSPQLLVMAIRTQVLAHWNRRSKGCFAMQIFHEDIITACCWTVMCLSALDARDRLRRNGKRSLWRPRLLTQTRTGHVGQSVASGQGAVRDEAKESRSRSFSTYLSAGWEAPMMRFKLKFALKTHESRLQAKHTVKFSKKSFMTDV